MKYHLTYNLNTHPKGINKNVVKAIEKMAGEGIGACDAVLLASIIYPADGSLSIYFLGVDGRKDVPPKDAVLEDIEWFKVWFMLAGRLAESKTLDPIRKDLALRALESVRRQILGHGQN